jgi:hypothetical protein
MSEEIWKDVIEGSGKYKVSNKGQIKSYAHNNPKILTPIKHGAGYLKYKLNGKTLMIHRIVATAFIPNPDSLPQVNHKDGDKSNNCAENLEWCTAKDNVKHALDNGLSKLKENAVNSRRLIRQNDKNGNLIKIHESMTSAARESGISQGDISMCCNNVKHHNTAGGYIWKFEDNEGVVA